jgi:hypothetical protein
MESRKKGYAESCEEVFIGTLTTMPQLLCNRYGIVVEVDVYLIFEKR